MRVSTSRSTVALAVLTAGLALASTTRAQEVQVPPPTAEASTTPAPAARDYRVLTLDDGDPIPPNYHRVMRVRSGLVKAGAALFGATYPLSLGVVGMCAAVACNSVGKDVALAIPGVGPFVQMARTTNFPGNAVLALDGLAQLGGIAMITIGVAASQEVFEPNAVAETFHLTLAPMLGPLYEGRYEGVVVSGTF
jgi:hypothetical protein